jgi:CheY-like chemotaxis protein
MATKTVLYVEDEETDVLLLRLALKKAKIENALQVVQDGAEAVEYLSGGGRYENRGEYPVPDLVLLDLNLPRLSGVQVLQWIREQPNFANLPVVIYTSSEDPIDKEKTRVLANDYVVKPSLVDHIAAAMQKVNARWLAKG